MSAVRARLQALREIFFAGAPGVRCNEHAERIHAARGKRTARPDTRKHRAPVLSVAFHFCSTYYVVRTTGELLHVLPTAAF